LEGNPIACDASRVSAREAERAVIAAMMEARLPDDAIDALSDDLRRRLASPTPGTSDKERERLLTRLSKLATLFSWGDITEADYRKQKRETEAALAAIPEEPDQVVLFDQRRAVVQSLGDESAQMTREGIQQVVALLVDRVETSNRRVTRIIWAGAARPFFTADDYTVAPPDVHGGPGVARCSGVVRGRLLALRLVGVVRPRSRCC
jgi:hypothetical protein